MASEKTLELSRREQITIAKSVADMGLGEPQYIGTYRKVVESVGKDEALRLYSGMSPEKSDFICSCGEKLDGLSVRWKLDALKDRYLNGGVMRLPREKKKKPDPEPWDCDDRFYDYDYDDFYGPKDTVTYARWLFNRYGADGIADHFHVDKHFAWRLGNSDLPGGIKVASLEGKVENIDAVEERIEDRHAAAFMNAEQLADFRKNGSRKLKVRMNRLMDHPEIYVLKKLLEAEEFSITAKECIYKYRDYNYGKKSERLKEAIGKLPDTGWHYWWQRDEEGQAEYIFYVELPGEIQVSWHGMSVSDMEGVPETVYKEWDGQVASTLPKIVKCIGDVCPAILEEKFDRKKCSAQLDEAFRK
jgi:hypothetical protein